MIRYLSKTLEQLLKGELKHRLGDIDVSFHRPKDLGKPSVPTFTLFLYDIHENVELRSNDYIVKKNNVNGVIVKPPVRISCSYLITAWPSNNSQEDDVNLEEQRLLSLALEVFAGFHEVPAKYIQGELGNQEFPLPMVTLQGEGVRSSDLWNAMGANIHPSFTVTVTICMPIKAETEVELVKSIYTDVNGNGYHSKIHV